MATVAFTMPGPTEGITSYVVYAQPGGQRVEAAGSPVTVTGLTNGTTYTFSVQALNSAGYGGATMSNAVVPYGVPEAPRSVTAKAGDGMATVTFEAPVSDGGSAVLYYVVKLQPAGPEVRVAGSPAVFAGLTNGAVAAFTVVAVNAAGAGPASAVSNAVTPLAADPLRFVEAPTFPIGVKGRDYPVQILRARGGTPPYRFEITDGTLPAGLAFASPQFAGIPEVSGDFRFQVVVRDSVGGMASEAALLRVQEPGVDLILSHSSLVFEVQTGAAEMPLPASLTIRSSDILQALNYVWTVEPAVKWLRLSGGNRTPGTLKVELVAEALALAEAQTAYRATIYAACATETPCAGERRQVTVSLWRTSSPAKLTLRQTVVERSLRAGEGLSTAVWLRNDGGAKLSVPVAVSDRGWLRGTVSHATLEPGAEAQLSVEVEGAALRSGWNEAHLVLGSGADAATLTVKVNVVAGVSARLDQTGNQHRIPWLGRSAGSFTVLTSGAPAALPMAVEVKSGEAWLKVKPAGAVSDSEPGVVEYAIDPAALPRTAATQLFEGQIVVTVEGAAELSYGVKLELVGEAKPVAPVPTPAGMYFISSAEAPAEGQWLEAGNPGLTLEPFQAWAATADGAPWLAVTPETGLSSAEQAARLKATVSAAGMAAGLYRGWISLALSSAEVRSVSVTMLVTGAACQATGLVVAPVEPAHDFQLLAGWPAAVAVRVTDNCGQAVADATVSALPDQGAGFELRPGAAAGGYLATWVPVTPGPQNGLLLRAVKAGLSTGEARLSGQVAAQQ